MLGSAHASSAEKCTSWLTHVPQSIDYETDSVEIKWDRNKPTSLVIEIADTHFPYPSFVGDRRIIGNETFALVNLGTRQKEADLPFINKAFEQAQAPFEGWQNIKIQFVGRKKNAQEILDRLRSGIFEKVNSVYLERKNGSLDEQDFRLISLGNRLSMNSDTWVVLKNAEHERPPTSPREFKENSLLTVTLTRLDPKSFDLPAFVSDSVSPLHEDWGLPHLYRFRRNEKYQEASRRLGELALSGKVAEITRFAKFRQVPEKVQAWMLLKLLESATDPIAPVRTLLISVDSVTRRLFLKFRFKDLAELETGKAGKSEYLMALDTQSADFKATFAKLKSLAQ